MAVCEYRMDNDKKIAFLEAVRRLNKGAMYADVTNTLGTPNTAHRMESTLGTFRVRLLTYYLTRCRQDVVNDLIDEYITFELNQNDLLTGAYFKEGGQLGTRPLIGRDVNQ